MFPTLEKQISESIEYAKRHHETAYLAGEVPMAYEHLRTIFDDALATVEFLQTHEHEWDENGFCFHCNADGNG